MLPIEIPFTRFKLEEEEIVLHVSEMRTREGVHVYALICPSDFENEGYLHEPRFVPYRLIFTKCPPDIGEDLHTAMAEALDEHVIPWDDANPDETKKEIKAAYDKIASVILAMSLSLEVENHSSDYFEVYFAHCLYS